MLKYSGFIMAIFYFMAGLSFIVLPIYKSVDGLTRYIIATLLLLYGIFRFYRTYNSIKNKQHENPE
jgi:hypothetical protein